MKFVIQAILKTLIVPVIAIFAYAHYVNAQTILASILPPAKTTFFDQNGKPLSGGQVFFYIPNTTTKKNTWQDTAETILNTNPVVLDSAGRAIVFGSGLYRQQVFDKNNNLIWDQITLSAGGGSGGGTATGDGDLVGTIKPWAGMTAPNQYVFTYGQEISRALFPALFTAITSTQAVFCNSGSPTLQGLGDTTNFWIGMTLEVSCLGAGNSTIISKTATTVTMAANANVTTNTNATFFPWGRGNGTTTFNLPDLRGYVAAGNDNMGGTPANVLTTPNFGIKTPDATGASGGSQTVAITLTTPNLPNVNFTVSANSGATQFLSGTSTAGATTNGGGTTIGVQAGTASIAPVSVSGTAPSGGTNTPFNVNVIQPTKTINYIIKITPDTNSTQASGVTSLGGMTGDIACGIGLLCTGNNISVTNIAKATSITVGGVLASSCLTSNWFNSLGDGTGIFGCTQPNFTDLAGSIAIGQIPNSLITYAKIQNGTGLSVIGVTGNAATVNADIVASNDNQVLRRLGTILGFGPINLTSSNAVSGGLANANLANMNANTVKANATGGSAAPTDVAPATARSNVLLNIDEYTAVGNTVYNVLITDRTVGTNAAFTASRTWTLPAANAVNAGQDLIIADMAGAVTVTNTLVIQRAGADTINSGTQVTISATNGAYLFRSDGISKWTAQSLGAASAGGVTSVTCFGVAITTSGTCTIAATKSDQQTGSSTTAVVTPSQQQQHDSAAKAWVNFVGSSGSINSSYNVTSVTRNSAGNYTINLTIAFATNAYSCTTTSEVPSGTTGILSSILSKTTTQINVQAFNLSASAGDPTAEHVHCFGRQ